MRHTVLISKFWLIHSFTCLSLLNNLSVTDWVVNQIIVTAEELSINVLMRHQKPSHLFLLPFLCHGRLLSQWQYGCPEIDPATTNLLPFGVWATRRDTRERFGGTDKHKVHFLGQFCCISVQRRSKHWCMSASLTMSVLCSSITTLITCRPWLYYTSSSVLSDDELGFSEVLASLFLLQQPAMLR